MIRIFKTKFAPFFKLLKKKEYYSYIALLIKYYDYPRMKTEFVNFLKFKMFVTDCLSLIFQFKRIFLNEAYKFDCKRSEPIIIDCGASFGISCLYFKTLFPKSKIIAFEADPYIADLLKRNLAMNCYSDIEVVNKAVWINNDGVEFGSDGADGGSIVNSLNKKVVPSIRLKDILNAQKEIELLKIDIEGAETDVLLDCNESLLKVNRIFVEYHSWNEFPQNLERLLNTLTNNNFIYYIENVNSVQTPLYYLQRISNLTLQLNIYAVKNQNIIRPVL